MDDRPDPATFSQAIESWMISQSLKQSSINATIENLAGLLIKMQTRLDDVEKKCDVSEGGVLAAIQTRLDDVEKKCDVSEGGVLAAWLEDRLADLEAKILSESGGPVGASEDTFDEAPCQTPGSSKLNLGSGLDFQLGESVWDASILLFRREIGFRSSCFLAGMLALNMFLQSFICYALLSSDEFFNPGAVAALLGDMNKWRFTDGHDSTYVNLQQVSLVSRVCQMDASLSLASGQLQLVKDINAYLSIKADDFELVTFSKGPILCMVCVLLLALVVLKEFRQSICLLLCIGSLPHGKTKFKGRNIVSLSMPRLISIFILTCARLTICSVILISGLCWLSTTTDIGSLILNAAALGFVLDVDEILFSSIVPTEVAHALGSIEPLRFGKFLHKMDAILPVLCASSLLIFAHQQYIGPNADSMLAIKKAMCGDGQNFFVAYKPETGMIASTQTYPFSQEELSSDTCPVMEAVRELKNNARLRKHEELPEVGILDCSGPVDPIVPIMSWWGGTDTNGANEMLLPQAEWSKIWNNECVDIQGNSCELAYVKHRLRQGFFPDSEPSNQFNCADYQQFCDALEEDVFLLKSVCPETCGCDDPLSGLFRGASGGIVDGCPESCGILQSNILQSMPCSDISTDSNLSIHNAWDRYWKGWIFYVSDEILEGEDDDEFLEELVGFKDGIPANCSAALRAYDALMEHELAREEGLRLWHPCKTRPGMRSDGMVSIQAFCPRSCCQQSADWCIGTCF